MVKPYHWYSSSAQVEQNTQLDNSRSERGEGANILGEARPGEVILEVRGITKRFPGGVIANDHVDFDLRLGEIHTILGENGAGKTTLMNIIYGLLQPDEGEIYIHKRKLNFRSPLDAINMGIGMVHQHRMLIPAHSVIENIVLGHPRCGKILNLKKAKAEVNQICEQYGFKIDLDAKIWQLSPGERQIVEILKALYRGAKILILDEPTSDLTYIETRKLLKTLRSMADRGEISIILITHKLPIALEVSDRITIMKNGKIIDQLNAKDANAEILARKMIGRDVVFSMARRVTERGEPLLQVEDLYALNAKNLLTLKGISFTIHEGEIFSVLGISGNGQEELVEVIAGLREPERGKVIFRGRDITYESIPERLKMGIGFVPAKTKELGAIEEFSLMENIGLSFYNDAQFSKWMLMDYPKLRELTRKLISEFRIVAPSIYTKAKHLSGGNLQKLVLARILSREPELLVAELPTRGLDIATTEYVRYVLSEYKRKGKGILLVTEDLEEAISLGDWIAPIYEGKFMGIVPAAEARIDQIELMMTGIIP